VKGLLRTPEGAVPGRPQPLVVQVHSQWDGYLPERFFPDGISPTGFAANPLVEAGFSVLQFDTTDRESKPEFPQGPEFVERLDSAVTELARRGMVDPARVGLVGWSSGSELVYFAITHPGKIIPAAAICIDGWDAEYGTYLSIAAMEPDGIKEAATYGRETSGTPLFWTNKNEWLSDATDFNVEKVRTPVLFTRTGGLVSDLTATISMVQTIGAFRLNDKPYDYIFFPQGEHSLVRPRERLASMETTIDWMRFWILGEEDARRTKEVQYARWLPLRKQQEQITRALAPGGGAYAPLPPLRMTH